MTAKTNLLESVPQTKAIPAEVTQSVLHALAEAIEAAFIEQIIPVSKEQRIAELAGVEYGGPQSTDSGTLHYFREPITGTSLAVWDRDLSVASVLESVKAAHVRFAVGFASNLSERLTATVDRSLVVRS
jgi:hypothetical protein